MGFFDLLVPQVATPHLDYLLQHKRQIMPLFLRYRKTVRQLEAGCNILHQQIPTYQLNLTFELSLIHI